MASSKVDLFTEGKIGDLKVKNRFALSPMTRGQCGEEMLANNLTVKYYKQRSHAGFIITEGAAISRQGTGWWQAPNIYRDEDVTAWKPVVEGVHECDAKIFCQLWHCGRASHSDFFDGKEKPVGPSEIALKGQVHTPLGKKDAEVPRALKAEEIPGIAQDYANAAEKAKAAGFDGVEIHSANGYLLDSFLQEKSNKRTDKYGGSIENRFQFLKEVVEAVVKVFPSTRVGVHLSPNGNFNDMGSKNYREQFLYVTEQLDKMDLAYVHFVDGLTFGFHNLGKPVVLSEFRKVYKGTIIGNCGYTKETANEQLARGNADFIAFGRLFISNPDLPIRYKNDYPIAPQSSPETWYGPPMTEKGYTDFPAYEESKAVESKA